jgi:predicted aspartyl protease
LAKPTPGLSFTRRNTSIAYELPTKVYVESSTSEGLVEAKAIWDTGASCSLITPEIAAKLKLKPVSKTMMATPSDKNVLSNVYLINIYLPNKAKIAYIQALEGILSGCDMLIGMDIISLGDFAVTNFNGKTMFSFRMPSMAEIDFTKHSHIEPI